MRALLAFPSTASFGQQAALAFAERGALASFMTSFAFKEQSLLGALVAAAPGATRTRLISQLSRRSVTAVPDDLIEQRPFWEIARTIADRCGAGPIVVDGLWDHLSKDFTRAAGRRLQRKDANLIYAYEYTALEAFKAARRLGIATILDFPSLNSRQFESIQRREKAIYPELRHANDSYFDARFERRQARRDSEMALADIIVTNSSVTRRSHVDAGADPERTLAVPYGAPPPIERLRTRSPTEQLRVVWAGTFSIRKGAHYFVQGWRALNLRREAKVDIYGAVTLPDRLWRPAPSGLSFHGSVVRPVLFEAFETADVLVFPTLSDGFGMVVTEAFARGLPVITTDQAGASDLVESGRNGLVIPAGDASAIADALTWCLNNRESLGHMRSAALSTAANWQWADYRRELFGAISAKLSQLATGASRADQERCA